MAMSREETNNYMHTSSPKRIKIFGELTWGKLFFLGLIAVLFSYGPLSLFAPVPLALGVLLYGRLKTAVMVLAFIAMSVALQVQFPQVGWLGISLSVSTLFGLLVSEIVLRRREPVKGLILTGSVLVGFVVAIIAAFVFISGVNLSDEVLATVSKVFNTVREQNAEMINGGGEEARILSDFLSKP